jgi:hypothetical protein
VGKKLSGRALATWEKTCDLNAELAQAADQMRRGTWARKTEFFPLPDGSIRRIIRRRDGTVENDHIIPSERAQVTAARAATGLSQQPLRGSWACRCAHSRSGNRAGRFHPAPQRHC